MEENIKKIMRIRKGEYLLELTNEGMHTTFDKDEALDISNWSISQVGLIAKSLREVGYKKVAIERIEK